VRVLVFVTDAFGGHGGIAKFNRDFITALCAHPRCTEVIAIPRSIANFGESLPSKLTYLAEAVGGKLKYIAATIKYLVKNSRLNLVVCGHINLLPIAFLARMITRAPLVLVMHGIDVWRPPGPFIRFLVKKIDAYISVSKVTEKRFLAWAGLDEQSGYILPNSINLDQFGPGEKSQLLIDRYRLSGKTVLMTLGRLSAEERYKGIDEVLEILPAIHKQIPKVMYLIVGDGSDRPRLEAKAAAMGVADLVVFAGLVPEYEKIGHYRLADAFVMPGRGEGFGIVYLEAMACGIPVVASKADGSYEAVLGGKLGIIVDPNNPDEILNGIIQALKCTKGVVPSGIEYFSYINFKNRCHQVIDKIIGIQ
jgi:phosphatidyl-myo-inositol dimannoside synthase